MSFFSAQKRLFSESIRSTDNIVNLFAQENDSLSYLRALKTTLDGKKLLNKSQILAYRRLSYSLDSIFGTAEEQLLDEIFVTLKNTQTEIDSLLRENGNVVKKLNSYELLKRAKRHLKTKFPYDSGFSAYERLKAIKKEHKIRLRFLLHSKKDTEEYLHSYIENTIRKSLFDTKKGRTGIPGGNAIKKTKQLFAAEKVRASKELLIDKLKNSNVAFGYWRLSPAHTYRGGETCELLSEITGDGVRSELERLHKRPSLTGLHLISNWPMYPHPYCMCFIEPLLQL